MCVSVFDFVYIDEEIVACLRAADFEDFLQFSDRDRWDELFPNLGLHIDHHM